MNDYSYIKKLYAFYLIFIIFTFISVLYFSFINKITGMVFISMFSCFSLIVAMMLSNYPKELTKLSCKLKYYGLQILIYMNPNKEKS